MKPILNPATCLTRSIIFIVFSIVLSTASQGRVLEEIIVTAQKREQNIQDVGISITAFSANQMRELGFKNAPDIASQTPGLNFDHIASGPVTTLPVIRAVSQNDYSAQQEPPVAVYVDGVYLSTITAMSFGMFDMERVEVLKGPQGTLFGRNATGGLIHYISARPTDEFEAYIDTRVYDRHGFGFRTEAMVNGELSDSVRGRLSGFYEQHDGWWNNNAPGEGDSFEADGFYSIRGQLEFDLHDDATVGVAVTHGEFTNSSSGLYLYEPGAADPVTGLGYDLTPQNDPGAVNFVCPGCDFFGQDGSDSKPGESSFNDVGFLESDYTSVRVDIDWQIGGVALKSITNYQDLSTNYNEDCDGSVIDYCQFPYGQDLEQWSQELRISGSSESLTWQAGIYYLDITQKYYVGFQSSAAEGFNFTTADVMDQDTESFAAFINLEYALTEQLRATLGFRWTEDEKDVASNAYFGPGIEADVDLIAVAPHLVDTFIDSQDDGDWSGKIGLDYTPTEDLLLFASVSRGNKAGGYVSNLNGFPLGVEDRRFGPEVLTSYEVGFKSSGIAGDAVQLNGSLFYYDYNDYQAFDFQGLAAFIRNRDASFSGGELELRASFGADWDFVLGTAFLFEKEVDGIVLPGGQLVDRDSPKAPDFTINGLLRKTWTLQDGSFSAQVSADYSDSSFASVSNAQATYLPSFTMVDARIAYAPSNEKWELAVFSKNLLDEDAQIFAFDLASFGMHIKSFRPPRMVGGEFRYNF